MVATIGAGGTTTEGSGGHVSTPGAPRSAGPSHDSFGKPVQLGFDAVHDDPMHAATDASPQPSGEPPPVSTYGRPGPGEPTPQAAPPVQPTPPVRPTPRPGPPPSPEAPVPSSPGGPSSPAPAPTIPAPTSPAPTTPAPAEPESADEPVLGPTGRPYRDIPEPTPLDRHGPATVIAVCNQKGGVGKTTSTINLGAALAEYGRRVLLVDLDPQGALSAGLGVPHHELEQTVYNLLVPPHVATDEVLMRTRVDGLDLLPSNIDLSAAEIQLVTEVGREQSLSRALHPVLDRYDYVLIDCQPSLGLLTVNALACSDTVIIPMECEYFSLRGLALLTDTVDKVRDRLNPRLELGGILVTMFDARTLHSRDVMARVVEVFGDVVYDAVISRTVRFPETSVAGEPITSWAPKSGGAAAYRALAREVIARNARPT